MNYDNRSAKGGSQQVEFTSGTEPFISKKYPIIYQPTPGPSNQPRNDEHNEDLGETGMAQSKLSQVSLGSDPKTNIRPYVAEID